MQQKQKKSHLIGCFVSKWTKREEIASSYLIESTCMCTLAPFKVHF